MTRMTRIALVAALVLVAQASLPAYCQTIAILAALDSELDALKKELDLVGRPLQFKGRPISQGRYRGQPVLLAQTGRNPDAAAALTRWLVESRRGGIAAVISIGPAGALNNELKIGDVVMPSSCRSDIPVATGNDPLSAPTRRVGLQKLTGCTIKPAKAIVTVDSFVATNSERRRLRETYHADAVDMSAAAIAAACTDRNIPCVILREITDRADEDAPRAFAEAVRAKQPRTVAAALCALQKLATDAH
jgi:adenosylhomocysteine nucleosidase